MASILSSAGWKGFLRWFAVVALVLVATLALAACGDDDDDDDGGDDGGATSAPAGETTAPADGGGLMGELQDAGVIKIGIANEAPYGFEGDGGEATGEAPEVAKLVLAQLGIPEVDAVVVDFGSLIPGLQAGQFDMIAAGMFITPDRAQEILFSDPDYCGTQAFAVAAGNPKNISDFASIADGDAIVGVLSGAVEEGYAEEQGIPDDQIEVFDSTPNVFEALQDGRIDAVGLTSITVNWQIQQLGDDGIESTPSFVYVDPDGNEVFGCGGYGFRQENQDFRDAFNDVLSDMKANDEILPVIEQFGFDEATVEQAKNTTVADLTE